MAGKSGRSINNVPENPMKHIIFSWEGILVILFILVNIFCASFSEFYNLKSVLRQMPVYLAEVFMMFPMAYILVLGEIDISDRVSLRNIKLHGLQHKRSIHCSSTYSTGCWCPLRCG